MKRIFTFIFASLLMVLTACHELIVVYPYPYVINGGETPDGSIQFGNYSPATKAIAGEGPNGVGYGDFVVFGFEDNTAIMDPYLVQWVNDEWVYEGISGQELKYYSRDASKYSFTAVITDKSAVRDGTTVNVASVESFQVTDPMNSPKEFLYANTVVEKTSFGQYVNLTFNHANARMYLGFASDRNDTQIIDYAPGHTEYTMTATTVPTLGPLATAITISDEDMAFINSKYTASKGFESYQTSNVITGNLDENMWDYLLSKYPTLSSINTGNWANYSSNTNMRLVHIDKKGHTSVDNDSYRAVWVNVQSVNWSEGTVIPGLEGIRVFSVDDSGSPIVHKVHTNSANAHISIAGVLSYDNISASSDVINFNIPTGVVAQKADTNISWAEATASPSIRYALPLENTGYVVKFSYTYNGVNYYDARVLIPTASADFLQSKDYTYVIYITANTNGTTDPNQAITDKDEVDTSDKAIVFSQITFGDYTSGGHYVYTVQ